MANYLKEKERLCDVAIRLNNNGFNHGATGNCSLRTKEGFLITPSGIANRNLIPEIMVELDMHGKKINTSPLNASSEWLFHKDLYRMNKNINAVIHTHCPYATALSTINKGLNSFHYMIAVAGGKDIRCAKYALFGTQELSNNILEAMRDRKACLIANHGLVTAAEDLETAYDITEEIEHLSMVYINAQKISEPKILSDDDMVDVLDRFQTYSRWGKD